MLSISVLPSSFLCYLSSAQYSSSHLSLPSPCNNSQPFYNPLGAVHNYPGSNCRSIYIRQCRGLASLMEVCVSSECIFHDLTAWAQALLGLIDVRLSLSGLAWVCSIKWAFAKSGQSRAKQQVAHLLRREKAATHSLTVLLRLGCFLATSEFEDVTVRRAEVAVRTVPLRKITASSDMPWPPWRHEMVWCTNAEARYVQQHI